MSPLEAAGDSKRPEQTQMSRATRRYLLVGVLVVCGLAVAVGGAEHTTADTVGSIQDERVGDETAAIGPELFEPANETVSEPELDVFISEPVVEAGTEQTVEVTILNTGEIEAGTSLDDETATARGVSVTVDDDEAPVTVDSGETTVGSIPPGEKATVPVSVTAPADADGDSGELDVEVSYRYTGYDDSGDAVDQSDTDSFSVDIEVGPRPQFEIDDVGTDTQIGTDGTVEVDLENVGSDDAEAVRVTAQSPTGGVSVGPANGGAATGPDTDSEPPADGDGETDDADSTDGTTASGTASSAAFLGDLDSGDTDTVAFDTRIDQSVSVESYLLELQVIYEDEDGILRESTTLATAVEPTGGQTFEISEVNSTLEVGESGTITAELENTGPEAVETPVVRAEPASDRVDIGESRVALDDLDDDESAEISFDADVSGQADPGARQVTFTVEYGIDGDRLESDPLVERVDVAADQPAFSVTADEPEIPAGTTETVELNVTNNRAERLSNINVFLYPDGPLSVDEDEAFIDELDAGETQTVTVAVSVDETASQRSYPLDIDFRYDDETDDDRISQVYQIPVTAAEPPPDDGWRPSLVSLAGLAVLVVGATAVIRWRQ